ELSFDKRVSALNGGSSLAMHICGRVSGEPNVPVDIRLSPEWKQCYPSGNATSAAYFCGDFYRRSVSVPLGRDC
ncbi:MAG: hypothetical protein K2W95_34185, partial [Candidatus Obscuribacterales bacterium]|nr:hypothetical protein [Candidatus Obscuribacterales bacterium]